MILVRLAWTERLIDNAGLMPVNDLDAIKDLELYDRLLNEFPRSLVEARARAREYRLRWFRCLLVRGVM